MALVQVAEVDGERPSLDWARHAWGDLEGLALLRAALTGPFAGRLAMVSSFGAESAVLLDMVASIDRRTPVVFLETGKLFRRRSPTRTCWWSGCGSRMFARSAPTLAKSPVSTARAIYGGASPTCAATSAGRSRSTSPWPRSPAGSRVANASRA